MAIVEGGGYLRVTDPEQSAKWFKEKLGAHGIRKDRDDMQEIYVLIWSRRDDDSAGGLSFGTLEPDSDSPPVLYAKNVEHAWKILIERGIQVGTIETTGKATNTSNSVIPIPTSLKCASSFNALPQPAV